MQRLRASSYVLDVSPDIAHFSATFKAKFWAGIESGKTPQAIIVIELGIDPETLGENQVLGLKTMIRNEVRAGKGFRDLETFAK